MNHCPPNHILMTNAEGTDAIYAPHPKEEEIKKILGDAIQPDGSLTGLHGGAEYVQWPHWRTKDRKGKAHLDGNFSAAELRAIADWMDSHS